MNVDETPVTLASIAKESGTVERAVESTGSSRSSVPVRSARIPRFAPTLAWKKSINALISGEEGKSTRRVPIQTSATSADVISSVSCLSTSSKLNAPKEIGWFDDVENSLFTSMNVSAEEVEVTSDVRNGEQVVKSYGRIFEECDCALEAALFNPKSWKKFKIPASCHSRPPIHFFAPRDTDALNPSIRIVVDNVNAFHHHSVEPNVPYANQDVEDLFYSVSAKNVRCFDGRVVGGVVRYNTSYAVVDFQTIRDAEAAFRMLQGRKAYPGSYHLRLKYVDVNDQTFGRRMAVSMGPMERSEEERRAFVEFVEGLNIVDVDLTQVALPNRPGFALPARPATPPES